MMRVKETKVPKSRSEILIREVFRSGFTWEDAERFFDIRQDDLKKEVKDFLSTTNNPDERFNLLEEQIKINGKHRVRDFVEREI